MIKQQEPVEILRFSHFQAAGLVVHGFSTRRGGGSSPPYDTLNLGYHTADDPFMVRFNRQRLGASLGLPADRWVTAEQVHGREVFPVTRSHQGRGAQGLSHAIPGVDALITSQAGVPLALFFADCVPLFILDPVTPAIGLAHAGWKGTLAGIGLATLESMAAQFGTRAADCLVGIGPAIGSCCYQVGAEVAGKFLDSWDCADLCLSSGTGWRLDLKQVNVRAFLAAGVEPENLEVNPGCTCCDRERFFSYRRDHGMTGRMGALMALK